MQGPAYSPEIVTKLLGSSRPLLTNWLTNRCSRWRLTTLAPGLCAGIAGRERSVLEDFSEQDRSLHSYATKFFSKANPFYTFLRNHA